MTVGELFSGIDNITLPDELNSIPVLGVTSDSREVEKGFVFVCVKGEHFDGHTKAELAAPN